MWQAGGRVRWSAEGMFPRLRTGNARRPDPGPAPSFQEAGQEAPPTSEQDEERSTMKAILGAAVMMLALTLGASAQVGPRGRGSQPQDSAQAAAGQDMMQQRMQQMQARMQSMSPMMDSRGQEGAQGMMGTMRGQGSGMQSMQGMQGPGGPQGQSCLAASSQDGLSVHLLGSMADLALTDEQRAGLAEILEQARGDALSTLSPEQRERLADAPTGAGPGCPAPSAGTPRGN